MLSSPLRLFAFVALCLAVAQAGWFDGSIFARQQSPKPALDRKQIGQALSSAVAAASNILVGTAVTATTSAPTGTTTADPTTSSSSATTSPSSTPTTPSTSSTSATPSKTSSTPTSTSVRPTSATSTTTSAPSTTAEPTTSVELITSVVVVGGSTISTVSSSTHVSTPTPSAAANSSSSSGISTKTKNTIIGVVVGVVGALLLLGLGIVAWRIWGRNKDNDDDDGLMGFRAGSGHEKNSSIGAAGAPNPFQSTLESYHGPPRAVNASSNF